MNKTGRPRNTAGSLYLRRNSRVWWMSYREQNGRWRQESTGQREKGEAEKVMRKRLVARDEGLLPSAAPGGENHLQRVGGLVPGEPLQTALPGRAEPPAKPRRAEVPEAPVRENRLSDITVEDIEAYLMTRLNTGKRVHTKLGLQLRGRLKPATVHQEFRILSRILNVAVKKRRLAVNPCGSVEFPVALAGTTRKPHYLSASEQARLEACAPLFLRNIIAIMVEMGLRPYRELIPMRKEQVDLENGIVHLPDSKTVNGITDMPMTDRACVAFASQMKQSGDSDYLFPSPRMGSSKPHIATVCKLWNRTLTARRAVPFFVIRVAPHVCDPAQRRGRGGSFRDADAPTRRRLGVQALQPGEAQHDAGSAVEARSAGERARCEFLYGTGRLEPVF